MKPSTTNPSNIIKKLLKIDYCFKHDRTKRKITTGYSESGIKFEYYCSDCERRKILER